MPNFKLKREGKYWCIRYSEGGRSLHPSTGQTDLEKAKKVLDNFVREYHTPKDADPKDIGIDVILKRYRDDKRGEIASPNASRRAVDQLLAYYGSKPVAYISAATNKEYELAARKDLEWSNATINRTRNVLRAALKHAVKDGQLHYAPYIPSLKVTTGKYRWLTKAEALELYRAVRHWRFRYLNLFIRIGLATGARHEAILQLTWDRVDLELGTIDFRNPDIAETNKRRPHAAIHDDLLRLLRAAYKVRKGDHVIMHRGGPIKRITDAFNAAVERAGLTEVTPHTMKHTCITWALRAGATAWEVQGLTNTSAATIEEHYGHHCPNHLRAAANIVLGRSARNVPETLT
jgi:integrase